MWKCRSIEVKKGVFMKLMTALLLFSLVLSSPIAFGRDKEKQKKGERLKEMNLSEEQMKKVSDLRKAKKESLEKSRAEVRNLKKSFQEAKANENTSNEELTQRFEALQKARNDLQRERFKGMIEMRSMLTPEQRKKFKELHKERKENREKGKDSDEEY